MVSIEKSFTLMSDSSINNLVLQGKTLLQASSDSAKLDSEILLSFVLSKDRSYLLTWPEKQLSTEQVQCFIKLLMRRAEGEPIAYIVGIKEFWSLPLSVSKSTLIPRPDTETLVELVLNEYLDSEVIQCLDLGTGTGAIALALASEKAGWKIDAIDFSVEAVQLAQLNAKKCQLNHVKIFQSDWFSNIDNDKKYDLIISNPPYIDAEDKHLTQGDVRYEPESALVAQDNGLADIRHIADNARRFLNSKGQLFIEHGFQQGSSVRDVLKTFAYENVQTKQDLNGHDRITSATWIHKT